MSGFPSLIIQAARSRIELHTASPVRSEGISGLILEVVRMADLVPDLIPDQEGSSDGDNQAYPPNIAPK